MTFRFIAGKTPKTPEELQIIEKRKRDRHFRIVRVMENDKQLAMIQPPAGICFSKLNPFESKSGMLQGSVVIVYGNQVNTNDFEKRDLDDIDNFIADNLTVIEDNPKGVNYSGARKYETSKQNEYTKKHGFNETTIELLDEQMKQINRKVENENELLKSKPFNSEDVQDKLEEPVLRIVEI
jgi:hypothetical protein